MEIIFKETDRAGRFGLFYVYDKLLELVIIMLQNEI